MITSKAASKEYLDNYDRIFGKKEQPEDEREQEVEEAETKDSEPQS